MGGPAHRAADGERRREQRARQARRRHHHAGEELDVARQLPVRLEPGQCGEDALPRPPRPGRRGRRTRHRGRWRSPATGPIAGPGAVHGMAEAHDPPPCGHLRLHPGLGARRVADGVEGVEGPTRRAAVQRPGERTEGGTDDVGQVGSRRGDDAGGERRGVEAVIDGQLRYCSSGPRRGRGRRLAGDQPEVVSGVAELSAARGVDRLQPEAGPVQRGDDRRHHGGEPATLCCALVGSDVDERAQAELVGGDGDRRPDASEGCPGGPRQGLEHGQQGCREPPLRGDGGSEPGQLGGVGQVADGHQVPRLLEAVMAGEHRRVVAAVVVEAGLTIDIADGGLGDSDAVQAGRYVDQCSHESIVGIDGLTINIDQINIDRCTTLQP